MKLTEKAEEILESMWIAIEEEGKGFVDLDDVGTSVDDPAVKADFAVELAQNRERERRFPHPGAQR